MWTYKQPSDNEELYHYGVKGMKWGVKRAIGADARSAAKLERYLKKSGRRAEKQYSKIDQMKKNGVSPDNPKLSKLEKKAHIDSVGRTMAHYMRKEKIANLSPKDIEKGRRQVALLGLLGLGD